MSAKLTDEVSPPKSTNEVPAYILTVYSLPLEGKVSAKLTDEVLPPEVNE